MTSSSRTQPTRVSLEREGVAGLHELQLQQVTAENLRRLFQVNPSDCYLRDEIDETTYFPRQDGTFNLLEEGLTPYSTLRVEGRSLDSVGGTSSRLTGLSTTGGTNNGASYSLSLSSTPMSAASAGRSGGPGVSSSPLPTNFRSVMAPKRVQTFSLKLIKAKMCRIGVGRCRKFEFQPVSQTFIELIEATANVDHILAIIRRRWGPDYILVTQDGLQIEDSPATQGLSFWKSPRRKIYAVQPPDDENSSDEDYVPLSRKKRKEDTDFLQIMSSIKADVEDIKSMTMDANTQLPMGLQNEICGAFKCTICHIVPIRPPVIIAKCCKSIIGCEECINSWYGGEDGLTKTCPLCRADRGFTETMRLNGIEGFIKAVADRFADPQREEESNQVTVNVQ